MRTFKKMLVETLRILDELRIEYVIVGGVAVNTWGNVRTTTNVDLLLSLKHKLFDKFVDLFTLHNFSITKDEIMTAVKEHTHFTIFDRESDFHLDCKCIYEENDRKSLKGKRKIKVENIECFIASPEDVIANKLLSGSEQDIMDALGIYVRQLKKLNHKYLIERCNELGVASELEDVKRKAERKEYK